ncbi:unnamed protein product [Anisakis simplex]|uniref:Ovule protein n=1 Tax=Anisakis simplex TaxID=6269 RepID=A0A0M3JJW1_ANISI|nr:unnamed protein product [Anisakis simplex]
MDETKTEETDQKSELSANDKLSGDGIPIGLEVECEEEPMHDEIDSNSGESAVKNVDIEKVNSESGTVSVELESAKTDEQQTLSEV